MTAHSVNDMAMAIAAAHGSAMALPGPPVAKKAAIDGPPVYQAAKHACLDMGFIDADAQMLALAWQSASDRTGIFDAACWPSEPVDFSMAPWPRPNAFAACPQSLGLYAVLPDAAWVARMAQAGVPTLQLRFKSDDAKAVEREVCAAVEAVCGTPTLLFINDHWQAAIAAGAHGVHLGQEDMESANLEVIRKAGLRLGLSSHGYAEMLKADKFSPSYIAMGAIYPTTLKRMTTPPQGVGRLAAYAKLMRNYPLVAIGGIDESRLPEVLACQVGSVAFVRAIVGAPNPEAVASKLGEAITSAWAKTRAII